MFIIVIVPGGSISQDGEKPRTSYCIFDAPEDMESMRNHEQVCNIVFRTHIEPSSSLHIIRTGYYSP